MLKSALSVLKFPLLADRMCVDLKSGVRKLNSSSTIARTLHSTASCQKLNDDRKNMMSILPAKDQGTDGEKIINIDSLNIVEDMFPTPETPNKLFNGIPFKDIPICNVKVSPNNTIICLTDSQGNVKMLHSCGREGFKNTRKGTNIAAQATAISLGSRAIGEGIKSVRVKISGLGPGRMSAVKGLQMGGLNIISITDATPVSWNPPRPRKPKRL
ncbi:uncharacterized protein LOC107274764 [Cephus cinctus]|uniref:Uncharacterized protein LOC107274764 n=1 Tax=Cephus cinctus TaxID=211228 RepID=A0AAJ7FV17_CEPCN|nr:uncharacterized protein LOC107274764 [Cephus cinctus]